MRAHRNPRSAPEEQALPPRRFRARELEVGLVRDLIGIRGVWISLAFITSDLRSKLLGYGTHLLQYRRIRILHDYPAAAMVHPRVTLVATFTRPGRPNAQAFALY